MTQDQLLASFSIPEASLPSSTPTPTIYTPPSEDSLQLNNPFTNLPLRQPLTPHLSSHPANLQSSSLDKNPETSGKPSQEFDSQFDSDEGEEIMVERSPLHRPTDGRSQVALLKDERGRPSYDSPNGSARPAFVARRSTFGSRSPEFDAKTATRRKYTYAGFFLILSLISFVIQTETAVYIQHTLKWNKAYCML